MKTLLLATATMVLLTAAEPSYTQHKTTRNQIIGTWTVVSLKVLTASLVKYPLGESTIAITVRSKVVC
jgi:hypothetical protein